MHTAWWGEAVSTFVPCLSHVGHVALHVSAIGVEDQGAGVGPAVAERVACL